MLFMGQKWDYLILILINAPKFGGGIDIKVPKIGGPSLDIHGPKFDDGLDIKGP